jgi:hypothetical protein
MLSSLVEKNEVLMSKRPTDIQTAIMEFSLIKADGPDRGLIVELYKAFRLNNETYFGGSLEPAPILLTPPTSPKAQADYANFSAFGCKHQIRVRPACARGVYPTGAYEGVPRKGWRMRPGHPIEDRLVWLQDLVLHEMVHLAMEQRGVREDGYKGHGPVFTSECNRIGAMLGLPNVRSKRRKGQGEEVLISSQWPFCAWPGGEHRCKRYGQLWEFVDAPEEAEDRFSILWEAYGAASLLDRARLHVGWALGHWVPDSASKEEKDEADGKNLAERVVVAVFEEKARKAAAGQPEEPAEIEPLYASLDDDEFMATVMDDTAPSDEPPPEEVSASEDVTEEPPVVEEGPSTVSANEDAPAPVKWRSRFKRTAALRAAAAEEVPPTVPANEDALEPPKKRGRPRKLADDPKLDAKREKDRLRKKALREAAASVLTNGDAVAP